MSSVRLFRMLVVGQWLVPLVGVVIDAAIESRLPEPLRTFADAQVEAPYLGEHPTVFVLQMATLTAAIVASAGLFFFRPWARRLYAVAMVVSYAVMPFSAPFVFSGVALGAVTAGSVLSGILLGWIFLGPRSLPPWGSSAQTVRDAAAKAPNGGFRPDRIRAYAVIGLLGAGITADVVGVQSGFAQRALLVRAAAGLPVTEAEAKAHDARHAAINDTRALMLLATAAGWLVWQHRAYRNLQHMGTGVTDHSVTWAIGWWFVPLMNLVRPFQVVKELWLRSATRNGAESIASLGTPGVVSAWWAAWILSIVVGRIVFRAVPIGEGIDGLQVSTTIGVMFHALNIIAALPALGVVIGIHRHQLAYAVQPDPAPSVGPRTQDPGPRTQD